ncbi:RpiB/LacA/LacB family sugar-phosphate isomerase [Candidatus Woesearchaeota archaeon]|nr:RpiB/LacA/LacB family sugar-phosphate isomerase [Candidatus Woesearchaeota archaeon]
MKIVIAADHGGFELKNKIAAFLEAQGYDVDDQGPSTLDPDDDYPDFGKKVAEVVGREGSSIGQQKVMGILICRSAAGIVIAANKFKGVRAVAAYDEKGARHSREHNDANVLGLSGDWTSESDARKIVSVWLKTGYSNEERHTRRLKKIAGMER